MGAKQFVLKLNDADQALLLELMARHRLQDRTDLVRRALMYFASAPVGVATILDAIVRLKPFMPSASELRRHREAKKRIDAGERGLDKAESLVILDQMPAGGRRGREVVRK